MKIGRNAKTVMKARYLDIEAGANIVLLNEADANALGYMVSDRVKLTRENKSEIAIVDTSSSMVKKGEIGLFAGIAKKLGAKTGEEILIELSIPPHSVEYIKRKMAGGTLNKQEIDTIISEMMEGKLSDIELAAFVTSVYIRGLSDDEIAALTTSIVCSGGVLDLGKHPVADKHCIGGVAGNRTTMLIVPIVAAAGIYIPKTSSRSITSASGTADTMEVLADVNFSLEEMREIVLKTNGCIVWGGAMNLAAADDKLIRIRYPLRLDPRGLLLASILAKKKSVNAEYVVMDVPVGKGTKIELVSDANALARDFIEIGKKLGMKVDVFITDGTDPVGRGIGPALECIDVLNALQGNGPHDLVEKSCQLAGALLEMCGKVEAGKGRNVAFEILKSGKALKKMQEIIEAQGGDPKIKPEDIPIGKYRYVVESETSDRIRHVDNIAISRIARAAGAPKEKGAGIKLHCEQGDRVEKGDKLFEIFAESEVRLDAALKVLEETRVIEFQRVVLGKVGSTYTFEEFYD
ncbi:MAG: AMP phosphorylase [Candidatus Micrarchaeia archaeon]